MEGTHEPKEFDRNQSTKRSVRRKFDRKNSNIITIFSTSFRASLTRKPTRIPAARPDQPVTWIRAPEPALVTALEHAATTSTEKGGTLQLKGYGPEINNSFRTSASDIRGTFRLHHNLHRSSDTASLLRTFTRQHGTKRSQRQTSTLQR